MRRLVVLGAGLLLVHTASGCKHVAGFCDCAPPVHPCCIYGLYPEGYGSPGVVPAAAAAPAGVPVGVPATTPVPVTAPPAAPAATPVPVTVPPAAPATELPAPGNNEPAKEKIGLPKEI